MRKFVSLVLSGLLCCFALVVQAATVTTARWGINDGNTLRLVVSADSPVLYNIELEGKTLKIVAAATMDGIAKGRWSIKSPMADSMVLKEEHGQAVLKVNLKEAISDNDYKTFVLTKTKLGQEPFRIVVDIANKKSLLAAAVEVATNSSQKSSWSSNSGGSWTDRFKKSGSANSDSSKMSANERAQQIMAQAKKQNNSSSRKEEAATANSTSSQNVTKKIEDGLVYIKGSGKYRTSGGVSGKVITLDAGHGGSDSGAVGQAGVMEKNLTLPITKRVAELLTKAGAKVHMTRTTDVDVYGAYATDRQELQARVNVAEKYSSDLFVSVHINSSATRSVTGVSCYYYPKTYNDARIARCIQNRLLKATSMRDLGIREAGFYVIKRNSMPATLLELGFISNSTEERTMNTKSYQEKAAQAIVAGIKEYFG